jgi:carbon storage regulator
MLVLTRQTDTSIIIGEGKDQVEVVILGVTRQGQVKVGIKAPIHVQVHRNEVYHRILTERAKCQHK